MKKNVLLLAVTLLFVVVFPSSMFGTAVTTPTLTVTVGGNVVDIKLQIVADKVDPKLLHMSGAWEQGGLSVTVGASLNSDPFILWSIAATNFTSAPVAFSALFSTPVVGGPFNKLTANFNGSITDGLGNGASASPLSNVTSLISPSGSVVLGAPCTYGPSFPTNSQGCPGSGSYGPGSVTFASYFPTSLQTNISFTLSSVDAASFNGAAILQAVPEPTTVVLLGFGLVGLAGLARRHKN